MSQTSSFQKSSLPPALQKFKLDARDIFLLTGIPISIIADFISGRFKPNRRHRERLTKLSRQIDQIASPFKVEFFLDRAKYRILKNLISLEEKNFLLKSSSAEEYHQGLGHLVKKHWPEIELQIAEKFGTEEK